MLTPSGPHDLHAPISRTARYKKITKPLLERQRRARINRCLDELKDLMVVALQAEGENMNKLEKADILELTVQHLHRLQKQSYPRPTVSAAENSVYRFKEGFSHCASEACHFLLNLPGLDPRISKRLVAHLGQCANNLETPLRIVVTPTTSSPVAVFSPPVSPPPARQQPPPLPPTGSDYVLTCTPSVLDLTRPMEGLLMTVGQSTATTSITREQRVIRIRPPSAMQQPTECVWRPWRE